MDPGLVHHVAMMGVARAPSIECDLAWVLPTAARLLEEPSTLAPGIQK